MKRDLVITQETFDKMLAWLNADRELAGRRYEDIRRRLILIFTCRGCAEPEDLADETINRVTKKVPEIASSYVGDPALYFYGVAQKVHLEYRKRKPVTLPLPTQVSTQEDETEQEYECLENCLRRLPPQDQKLVVRYYQDERQTRIEHRKSLAEELGIALNALRLRAFRIRASLQSCVLNCLNQKASA